jgi:glycosyltransferase involved in cell wall biosynthesis
MPKLSVVIITLNEADRIGRCLEPLKSFASEILIVDSGSSDQTEKICMKSGCRVLHRSFDGFASQKQFAVDRAVNDWVLILDADEVISPELATELCNFVNGELPEGPGQVRGIFIPFILEFMGRRLVHCGTGKNLRLFDRRYGKISSIPVHETVEIEGKTGEMKGRLIHYSYRNISHHLEKMNHYTSLAAKGYYEKGRKFSKFLLLFRLPATFWIFYFRMAGFRDGYPGFMWSMMAGIFSTVKAAKSIELERKA